jgi:uncharacterized protein (TIGR02246 family)
MMIARALLIGTIVLCSAGQVVNAASPTGSETDKAAIKAVIQQLEDANNAGDVERWVGLFAPDFVYMTSGMPAVTSREELVNVAKAGFRNAAAVRITPIEVETCGDLAFVRAAVSGTVKLHGSGESITVDMKELLILSRSSEGTWRIARLMNNANR